MALGSGLLAALQTAIEAVGTNITDDYFTKNLDQTLDGRMTSMPLAAVATGTDGAIIVQNDTTGATDDTNVAAIKFLAGSASMLLALRADGQFGIGGGTTGGAWKLYINSNTGDLTTSGNVSGLSDPRLKENIVPLSGALDKVMQLGGYSYDWKQDAPVGLPGKHDWGVLSSDVKKVIPAAISSMEHKGIKYDTVAYTKIIPLLIEAIKELNIKVELLEARLQSQ